MAATTMELFTMIMFQRLTKKRDLTLWVVLIIALILNIVWVRSLKNESNYLDRAERIAFLISELNVTPERQQRALDEIVKDESGAFIYLLKHLDDRRPLAHNDVLFLNTHPHSFEKYFHAGGTRVDEAILRYLCWKTDSCDVSFDLKDSESVKIQRKKVEQYVKDKFMEPNPYEN